MFLVQTYVHVALNALCLVDLMCDNVSCVSLSCVSCCKCDVHTSPTNASNKGDKYKHPHGDT